MPFSLLPEYDRELLKKFRENINKFENKLCPVCNEQFPSVKLVAGACRRCYMDKGDIKKFFCGE